MRVAWRWTSFSALWLFLGLLLVLPVWYFLANFCRREFLDGAMASWLATAAGIISGVPVGFWIARKQQRWQDESERAKRNVQDEEHRERFLLQLAVDQKSNAARLCDLEKVLQVSVHSRTDLWSWALRIVEAFSFEGITRLRESNLVDSSTEPWSALDVAWSNLAELRSYVRQAAAAHEVAYGFFGSPSRADTIKEAVIRQVVMVRREFDAIANVLKGMFANSWDGLDKEARRWVVVMDEQDNAPPSQAT
jgi:hypothetical protein